MARYSDWERRLETHFGALRATSFQWGQFDCAMAICQGVLAITGLDAGAGLRGEYATADEAAALIALNGATLSLEGPTRIGRESAGDLGTLAAALAEGYGFGEVPARFAQRGDVVLVDNNDPGHALGTVDLSGRFAWCVGERGFARVPMRRWLRAWRIG